MAGTRRLAVVVAGAAVLAAVAACGPSPPGGGSSVVTATPSAAPTQPASATPLPITSASPGSGGGTSTPGPGGVATAAAESVARQRCRGGGDSTNGREDCLTTVSSCPVTQALLARFSAFGGSDQPHNAGAGSQDPVCRGCQSLFNDVQPVSVTTNGSRVVVVVDVYYGSNPSPVAVIETSGQNPQVDDLWCIVGGSPDSSTSLYSVSNPTCPS